jgi:hypothetical protein
MLVAAMPFRGAPEVPPDSVTACLIYTVHVN